MGLVLLAAGAPLSAGGMAAPEPAVTGHEILFAWQGGPFAVGTAVVVVAAFAWYVAATRRLGARGRRWSLWRTVATALGLGAVEVAIGSSVAVLAGWTFTAHVIQHLLLMVVAPPLLALGAPMTLILQTVGRPTKRAILVVLHSRAFAVVSHPVPVFFLYYLAMYAFFLTGALGYAMVHLWVMDLANVAFLGGATLFWWPMVGLDPIPRWAMSPGLKVLNLMVGIPVESFLGIALLMAAHPVAPMFALASTHEGGGVLWAATELATVAALGPVFVQWTRADARAAKRIDAHLDAGGVVSGPVVVGHGMAANLRALRRG